MTRLYSTWAHVYHEMYQSIFDYRKNFLRFQSILKKYRCKSVLELGCGTGMLAPYFISAGYQYTGVDSSREMLTIACKQAPEAHFVQADMRHFLLPEKAHAALVAGRTFSYMITNHDMLAALKAIHKALRPKGILIFDSFEASRIFTNFRTRIKEDIHSKGRRFVRQSELRPDLRTGWSWHWDATYVVHDGRNKQKFRDRSVLRSFTRDELRLFLRLAGFKPLTITIEQATMLTVAQKLAPIKS